MTMVPNPPEPVHDFPSDIYCQGYLAVPRCVRDIFEVRLGHG